MDRVKRILMISAALLLAFLVGVLVGYWQVGGLRSELEAEQSRLAILRAEQEMSEIRDLAALMYLETTRQNFGLATQHADRYFERVTTLAQATTDPHTRLAFSSILERRDPLKAALGRADSSAAQQVQNLYFETYRATKETDEAMRR